MAGRRSIDTAGVVQLVGAGVLGAAAWAIVFAGGLFGPHFGVLPAVVIGIVAAGTGILALWWSWEQWGGRDVVVMVNRWIRERAVPQAVPEEVWMPLLLKRERSVSKSWAMLMLVAVELPLAILNAVDAGSPAERFLWVATIVLWGCLAFWIPYSNLRRLPVIRRLIRARRAA
ncbi:MAG TPA: hypothetical protein VN133_07090 [Humibacter sp.]|nr:hypothetical protein [Humibacter sp.]